MKTVITPEVRAEAISRTIIPTNIRVRPTGNIFKLYMSCRPAYAVTMALYDDAITALDRKAIKAASIIETFGHYG